MSDQPTSSRPAPPPLRIHHFLACGAVAALHFASWRLLLPADAWERVATSGAATIVLFATGQIIQAVGLTLAILSVYWHVKGHAALIQPGQWLLIAISIAMLRPVSMSLIGPMVIRSPWGKNFFLWSATDAIFAAIHLIAIFVFSVLPILFFSWLAWRIADTRPWRVLFTLKALGSALVFLPLVLFRYWGWSLGDAVTLLATSASVGMMLCAIWAPVNDYIRGIQRTWTHWIGVGLFLAQLAVRIATFGFYSLNLL